MSQAALRVCIVHNRYQQYGGEDAVVDAESSLLRERGHAVEIFEQSNDEVAKHGLLSLAVQAHWSRASEASMESVLRDFRPDVVHVHNTMPLISPSAIWAARRHGVPVVQTLHNFRLACLNGVFLREQKVCESCLGRSPVPGVLRRCYRGSFAASAVLASTTVLHRMIGTYTKGVDLFIALNTFCKAKMVQAGLPEKRIRIKPNFVPSSQYPRGIRSGIIFVGRLSEEKGVRTLASAMRLAPALPLKVIGDGPLKSELIGLPNVTLFGQLPPEEVRRHIAKAEVLVVPSIWYENFPRTIVEAYAEGTPVVASRLGALPELVDEGRLGLLFEPGNPSDLVAKLIACLSDPARTLCMGENAGVHFKQHLSSSANYDVLRQIYEEAIRLRQGGISNDSRVFAQS